MLDEIFPLAITFPRFVRLENTRLTVLYWSMALIVLFFTTFTFVMQEGYYFYQTPSGNVQFWVQANSWKISDSRAKELNEAEEAKEHCANPARYEFCDDPECAWSARNMECIDLCTEDSEKNCMELPERWVKTESSLFFPTFFQETSTSWEDDPSSGSKRRTKPEHKWRIVKGIEDMSIGFQHNYNVQTQTNNREEGSSTDADRGMLTVLFDSDGNEVGRWEPGTTINLSLKQILKAGKISLDTLNEQVGQNYLEGAQITDGILARLAGADITLELAYHNYAKTDWTSGPECRITVHYKGDWTSHARVQALDDRGSTRFRYYQGLRITFKPTGSFSWVSMDLISNKLTQCLVFFGAVKQLVFIFSINFLGVVSKIYRGFVFQKASLGKEACGMASRLISHTSTFVELKDQAKGISRARLLRRFKRVFSHNSELDDGEIGRLVDFVFNRMAKFHDDGIDVQDFGHACTYGEALHFKTFVELFDADRSKGCLERTFAGPQMRALFKQEDDYVKERDELKISLSKSGTSAFASTDKDISAGTTQDTDLQTANNGTPVPDKVPEEEKKEDFDLLETVKETQADTIQLKKDHAQFNDTVSGHMDVLNDQTNKIDEVQASIKMQADQLQDLLTKENRRQQEDEEGRKDLNKLREQIQALKEGKDEGGGPELERLKQKSEQLELDLEKLSHRIPGNHETLIEVRETRKSMSSSSFIRKGQDNVPQTDSAIQDRGAEIDFIIDDQNVGSRREQTTCGVPAEWNLCPERVEERNRTSFDPPPRAPEPIRKV